MKTTRKRRRNQEITRQDIIDQGSSNLEGYISDIVSKESVGIGRDRYRQLLTFAMSILFFNQAAVCDSFCVKNSRTKPSVQYANAQYSNRLNCFILAATRKYKSKSANNASRNRKDKRTNDNEKARTIEIQPSTKQKQGKIQILKSASNKKEETFIPPWIPQSKSSLMSSDPVNQYSDKEAILTATKAKYNLHLLNQALEKHEKYHEGSFTKSDSQDVLEAVFASSKGDIRFIMAVSDFLVLLLNLEEYNNTSIDNFDSPSNRGERHDFFAVMNRDALIAACFHYCDAVVAREAGIYEIIKDMMSFKNDRPTNKMKSIRRIPKQLLLNESTKDDSEDVNQYTWNDTSLEPLRKKLFNAETIYQDQFEGIGVSMDSSNTKVPQHIFAKTIHDYGNGAFSIYESTARVKRAEIMSHSLLPKRITSVTPSPTDAASLRGLLLSMAEDWRALAIRSSASLYRLRGIVQHEQSITDFDPSIAKFSISSDDQNYARYMHLNIQNVREAREAMQVYAPLAGRLGMHRLKSELENLSFRILYKRQYNIAKLMYNKSGTAVQSVTHFLEESIEELLNADEWLSPQLSRLTVESRVKKPYSMWRKLLKIRNKVTTMSEAETSFLPLVNSDYEKGTPPLITYVNDVIAMRVIIRARRNENESDEELNSREEFLCYYIQNRLLQIWPASDLSRVKDYISDPKPNGYMSLHHTSHIVRYGYEWPFEVQIRSESMHIMNEFGVAAHWDYKLKGKSGDVIDLTAPSLGVSEVRTPFLLPSGDIDSLESDINESSDVEKHKLESLTRASVLQSYIEALSTARSHLLDNSVFVFFVTSNTTVEGKVVGLPIGSSVANALMEICKRCDLSVPKSFDGSKFDVYLNGKLTNLHKTLQNGDTLVVPGLDSRVAKYLTLK
jgi:ppGpp synthetase/RelA/SpoT-type nucleotidyltranferase